MKTLSRYRIPVALGASLLLGIFVYRSLLLQVAPVSSINGEIKQILLSYGGIADEETVRIEFASIFRKLPKTIEYVVVTAAQKEESIARTESILHKVFVNVMRESGILNPQLTVVAVEDPMGGDGELTEWVQDVLVVLKRGDQTVIKSPGPRGGPVVTRNGNIAPSIAHRQEYVHDYCTFKFVGGDVLFDDNFVLVGHKTDFRNEGVEDNVKEEFGVEQVIWVEKLMADFADTNWRELLYHLDIYLTLGGKTNDEKELIFIGEVCRDYVVYNDDGTDNGNFERDIASLKRALDHLAKKFSQEISGRKFDVARIPLIVEKGANNKTILRTYNNCLVESYGQVRNVYLPFYSSQTVSVEQDSVFIRAERTVRATFDGKDFDVELVDYGFMELSENRGAFHCIAKVLQRRTVDDNGPFDEKDSPKSVCED